MGPFDIAKARGSLRQREEQKRQKRHELFLAARHDAEDIIRMIIRDFSPTRIYQWGSLLEEKHFSEISDIDIAVEGKFSAEEYFSMLGKAAAMTKFPIDLVELDKINPVHAESIRKKGRMVYERK